MRSRSRSQISSQKPSPAQSLAKKGVEVAALLQQGLNLHRSGRLKEAKQCYQKILAIDSKHFDALQLSATLEGQLGSHRNALMLFDQALQINRTNALVFNNRGVTLEERKRFGEALASYAEAIRIKPDYAEAFSNRGTALKELKCFDDALASYAEAIRIKPDYAEAFKNRGVTLQELKRFDEALASYVEAIRIKPDYAEAFYARGVLRLLLRQFRGGFVDYLQRWNAKGFPTIPQPPGMPRCKPKEFHGRILLWSEQGLGDEIFYASMLSEVLKHDVAITLSADNRLHPIFRRSFPNIRLLDKGELVQSSVDSGYDAQAPIGDLGYLLELEEASIRANRNAYLKADVTSRTRFRSDNSLFGHGPVCGIAWNSANSKLGGEKSIKLESFERLLSIPGMRFVNLQYGDVASEIRSVNNRLGVEIHQMRDLDLFNDIDGLLALIDACDVIVTTSNVTAHLAGSIGKRAAVLVPHGKGRIWYWHNDDEYSFWYPSLRLFYQDNPFDWKRPLEACEQWVRSLV